MRKTERVKSKFGFPACGANCCAVNCSHKRATHECNFYSFPKEKKWYDIWVNAVKRCKIADDGKPRPDLRWQPEPHHKLCSCHFSIAPNPKSRRIGWNHVTPDLLQGAKTYGKERPTVRSTNRIAIQNTKKCSKVSLQVPSSHDNVNEVPGDNVNEVPVPYTPVIDDNVPDYLNQNGSLQVAVAHDHDYLGTPRGGRVVEQFEVMKRHVPEFNDFLCHYNEVQQKADKFDSMVAKAQILTLDFVKSDAGLFQYYTGLPSYAVFLALYRYFYPKAVHMKYISQSETNHHSYRWKQKPGRPRSLRLDEEFFATLVRLRLGLPSKDTGNRFGIAESTFSVIFNTWIIFLAQELELICITPSSKITRENQAECFSNFDNVRIVLDCTEVFSQTPTSLTADMV